MTPTSNRLSVALEMCAQLSERCDDGDLRDQISHVRDALWAWRDEVEGAM